MNILLEADKITSTDRRDDYGDALECCERIAKVWSAILNHPVTAEKVCLCMTGLKIIRECQGHKRDNIVDIAGYARVLEMCLDSKNIAKSPYTKVEVDRAALEAAKNDKGSFMKVCEKYTAEQLEEFFAAEKLNDTEYGK